MDIQAPSLTYLPTAASAVLGHAGSNRVFLFYGDMGAGKTTFIKALCAQLGIADAATSPTFSIVNEYKGTDGPVYHFDFYRLKNESEALDMGYEEYLYSGCYCFIEWPEKIAGLIPDHYTRVGIQVTGTGNREITVENI